MSKIKSFSLAVLLILIAPLAYTADKCLDIFSSNAARASSVKSDSQLVSLSDALKIKRFSPVPFDAQAFQSYKQQIRSMRQIEYSALNEQQRILLALASFEVSSEKLHVDAKKIDFEDAAQAKRAMRVARKFIGDQPLRADDVSSIVTGLYVLSNRSLWTFFTDLVPSNYIQRLVRDRVEHQILKENFVTALKNLNIPIDSAPLNEAKWRKNFGFFIKLTLHSLLFSKFGFFMSLPKAPFEVSAAELKAFGEVYLRQGPTEFARAVHQRYQLNGSFRYFYDQVVRKTVLTTSYTFLSIFLVANSSEIFSSLVTAVKYQNISPEQVSEHQKKMGADYYREITLQQYLDYIKANLNRDPTALEIAKKWQQLQAKPDSYFFNIFSKSDKV